MNEKGRNAIAAMTGIVLLAGWALYLGYDGVLLTAAIGVVSGLGGYPILQDLKLWYDYRKSLVVIKKSDMET